jgi:non-specific serine/threonine protein kinase/serine/threonine-protein kinase
VTVDQTQAGLRLMTPEYASPEQVRGEKITTASDVYSLGVLLYELLTGHRPYNVSSRAPHEIMRIICEEEPAKPSTAIGRVETMSFPDGATRPLTPDSANRVNDGQLAKLRRNLRGDLDNIALMALRKEPERRYTTVNQLSEDIRRHLEGLPVIARKDTLGYRSAKFIRRNRVAVLAATAFLILIVISLVGLSAQAARIASERDRAVAAEKRAAEQLEQAERAREAERQQRHLLANFALFDLHDAIEQLPGSTPVREMLVTKGLEYLDSLAKEATNDRSLRQELGTAYRKVGDVQGRPLYANLGYSAEAMKNYRRSLEELEPLAAADPENAPVQLALALSYDRVGDGLIQMGYATRSLEAYRKELAIAVRLSQTRPNDPQVRRALARAYLKVGDSTGTPNFANLGQLSKALEYQHRALNIRERLVAENPNNIEDHLDLAISYGRVGIVLVNSGQTAQGLEIIRKGVKIDEDALKGHPDHAMTRRELVVYYGLLGNVLAMVGDLTGAMENYRRSLDLGEGLLKSDPRNANLRNDVAQTYTALGNALAVTGDPPNGLENIRKGLSISEDLVTKDSGNMMFRAVLSSTYSSLSGFFTSTGNLPAAQNHIRKALDASETISAVDPQNIQARLDIRL